MYIVVQNDVVVFDLYVHIIVELVGFILLKVVTVVV